MADHILTSAQNTLSTLSINARNWQHGRLVLSAITGAVLALAIPAAYRDYRTFIGYGPNGAPSNVFGWFAVSVLFRPFGREMIGTGPYEEKIKSGETTSFLAGDVPTRDGERPVLGPHVTPQRQTNQIASKDVQEKLKRAYDEFAGRNPHLLRVAPSQLERHTDAIFMAQDIPGTDVAKLLDGEISHIHGTAEYSVHMTMSPADCKKVLKAGWGQRHALSGSSLIRALTRGKASLPEEYILVYAPRNEEEIEIVMNLLVASVKYVTGSAEVR